MELKEILAELGINDDPEKLTIDQFREKRDALYIGRNVAHEDEEVQAKVTGKVLGSLETKLHANFKELGVELTPEEKNGKKLSDLIGIYKEKLNGELTTLKESAKQGNDEKLTAKEKEIEKLNKKLLETNGFLETTKQALTTKEQEFESTVKNFKRDHLISQEKAKIPISETANEFTRKGFEVSFAEKYDIDMEDDKVFIIDRKTKQKVKNSQGNDFATFGEVYTKELDAAGLLKKNNSKGGQPIALPGNQGGGGNQGAGQQGAGAKTFTPHPNLAKNRDRLGM